MFVERLKDRITYVFIFFNIVIAFVSHFFVLQLCLRKTSVIKIIRLSDRLGGISLVRVFQFLSRAFGTHVVSKYSVTLTFDICNIKVIVYSNHLRSEIYIYTRSVICLYSVASIK